MHSKCIFTCMIFGENMKRLDQLKILLFKILIKNSPPDIRVLIARKWGVKIGKDCTIFECSFGTEPYLISIGNHTEIAGNVSFITHDDGIWIFQEEGRFPGSKYGPIIIHDNCYIGSNAIILPGVVIGPNSIIGAGSVVTKNVPPNKVYAGNPAKCIYGIDDYLNKCELKNTGKIRYADKRIILVKIFKDRLNERKTGR